ncbi:hypothetical protein PBI_CHE12_49 [Mycobacterium phage Che12]|uniref:Uncharacterized protein n=1 Tax=Mycobacterium phage Che12 TaxID=2911435 RepID=Q1A0G8_9CAUD|nr:HTH DNA binding protein [Mycobacterium phage Che12]ABE67368.1 hypothetical protein PBI_CHE12_49 [Mycobacterium phage Che12]
MRKKHLKAALAVEIDQRQRLADEVGQLNSQKRALKNDVDRLVRENATLHSANTKLSQAANQALRENGELRDKQRRAGELFGKAFAQVKPETGPSRPNRKKLTPREVQDIRAAYRGGMKQKDLASNYGVNPATISRTVRGIYH